MPEQLVITGSDYENLCSSERRTSGRRIEQLDGLRAVAMLSVFAYHAFKIPFLWLGVDIFFVLSGFLVTGILLDRRDAGGSYFGWFYSRRARRILVPCLLVMLVSSIFFGTGWLKEWYWYASFAANIPQVFHPGNPQSLGMLWSLAVEEQFYLVWPIVILASGSSAVWIAGILAIAAPVLRAICTPLFHTHFPIYYLTPFRMDLLACGALICFAFRKSPERVRSLSAIAQFVLAAVVLAVPLLGRFAGLTTGAHTMLSNVFVFEISLVIACCMLIASLNGQTWFARMLKAKWLRALGTISYSMYLVQMTCLVIAEQHFHNRFAIFLAAFSAALVYSALSWRFIESKLLGRPRGSDRGRVIPIAPAAARSNRPYAASRARASARTSDPVAIASGEAYSSGR